jgi:hypothetical protein
VFYPLLLEEWRASLESTLQELRSNSITAPPSPRDASAAGGGSTAEVFEIKTVSKVDEFHWIELCEASPNSRCVWRLLLGRERERERERENDVLFLIRFVRELIPHRANRVARFLDHDIVLLWLKARKYVSP